MISSLIQESFQAVLFNFQKLRTFLDILLLLTTSLIHHCQKTHPVIFQI